MVTNVVWNIVLIILIVIGSLILTTLILSLLFKIPTFLLLNFNPTPSQQPELVKKKHFVTSDGYELKWHGEIKEATSKIIVGVHDFPLNAFQFEEIATYLEKEQNISFVSYDQRYFAKNQKEEPRYRNAISALSDLEAIVSYLKEKHPEKEIYLYGAGYGANLSVLFMKKKGYLASGIILDSILNFKPYRNGSHNNLRLFNGVLFSPYKSISLPLNGSDFTNDLKKVQVVDQAIVSDSLITVKEYFQMKNILKKSLKKEHYLTKRVLMIQGENDVFEQKRKIVDFFQKIGFDDKKIITFENHQHNLALSGDVKVYEQIKTWINQS